MEVFARVPAAAGARASALAVAGDKCSASGRAGWAVLGARGGRAGVGGAAADLRGDRAPARAGAGAHGAARHPRGSGPAGGLRARSSSAASTTLTREIYALAGEEFTIASPKQLATILFEKLGCRRHATDEDRVLDRRRRADRAVARHHALPGKILEHRTLAKLKGTYADALPAAREPRAPGRIHTTFNQLVAATGRLSSQDPNLMNIPIRTELGRRIRAAFIPEEGWRFVAADYSQIELRILAHLSGEPGPSSRPSSAARTSTRARRARSSRWRRRR